MICPACQAANPEGAKFCGSCGARLALACPSCGTPAAPGARFCQNCGHALVGATPASPVSMPTPAADPVQSRLEAYIPRELLRKLQAARTGGGSVGERRVVTVLFCDVQGSTALAESLDPEDWAEIMNGAFRYLIEPVYRYEGTLARLMGDAILAFFGAPIGHEDDPRRAVLAGLEILQGIQPYCEQLKRERAIEFNVRVGINTGLVVVGEVGSDLRVEYTAMGDAVNLAARMEQTAQPGSVQISAATRQQVAGLFEMESLGPIEVKGKAEPVEAFRVLGVRAGAAPTRGIEGLRSPLVGRDRQLAALEERVADLRTGRGQIVSITGDAGLGKSRLLAELRSAAGEVEAPSRLLWLEGRSFSYESARPYTPFLHLLGSYVGTPSAEAKADPYARLRERLAEALPDRAAELAPFLATLLGVEVPAGPDAERVAFLSPPQLRAQIFGAVSDLLEAEGHRQPTVLVFEDLHWVDQTSLDLLEHLLPLVDRTPLMLLALFRPNRDDRSWRFHELAERAFSHRYTRLELDPLGADDSRQLVANLLHVEDLPERVRALILKKSEGNPFYVEEVIRSLLDAKLVVREDDHWRATREIENIVVPETLAGVITARLDRLEDAPKRVVQTASVVGREFSHLVLAETQGNGQVLEGALTDLERRELIHEKSRPPQRAYTFKHVLTQETAYASLLLSQRREVHGKVAECLERHYPEQVQEIAHHFVQARQPARALPYVVQSGEAAARGYATSEAIGWFRQAIAILETERDTALARRAFEGLGKALDLSNDLQAAVETYGQMLAYAEAQGDVPMKVSALNRSSFLSAFRLQQFPEAQKHLDEAERLAREAGDELGLVEHSTIRCAMCIPAANFDGALSYLGEGADIARRRGYKGPLAVSLAHLAMTQTYMTRFDDAMRTATEAVQVAEEIGDLEHLAEARGFSIPMCLTAHGDLDTALQVAEDAAATAFRIGALFAAAAAALTAAGLAHGQGEYRRALRHYQSALDVLGPLGDWAIMVAPATHAGLVALYADLGERVFSERAAPHLEAMRELEPMADAAALGDLAFVALGRGDLARASELFERGLTRPSRPWLLVRPRLLVGAALTALASGDLSRGAQRVDEARQDAEARQMRHFAPLVDFADAQVALASGDPARALPLLERAEGAAQGMHLRTLVWPVQDAAAAALTALGREDEAEAKRRAARETRDTIAALIDDETLRAGFRGMADAAPTADR